MSKIIKVKETVKSNLLEKEHITKQGNKMFFMLLSDIVTLIISASVFYLVFILVVKNITALML